MSTHFTRRGGTPATPRRDTENDPNDRRFTSARERAEREERPNRDDEPVSPLVAEQRDPDPLAAPVRDRAAVGGTGGGWRSAVALASGLNVLAGIWLIIAPFVLGYGGGDPYWNDIVFGAIVGIIGVVRLSGAYRASWLSLINALIGIWIFISAFWLDSTSTASANDIILGGIVFVLAIASASASDEGKAAERHGMAA